MFYNINFSLFAFQLLNLLLEFISPSFWQSFYFCCSPHSFKVFGVISNIKTDNVFYRDVIFIFSDNVYLITCFDLSFLQYLKINTWTTACHKPSNDIHTSKSNTELITWHSRLGCYKLG